ncbi:MULTISPECIES: hypothetical protein [Methanobacterium]|jgi:hypothetical protein|uniref:Uncharacterized protein n=1 Tax=Methanobacterium bryantii TaxID=2161 RepID=A0A2A2H1J7_METBR|nr:MULTISPECIES: hypothetical protein [Methanobacterium]OEC86259.1 hypothetical protein A9507_11105 [Methanobacterium sp. A39]PAV03153.1 hypothetical protein ASJ80_07755 [Methanobacterium bryantii]
MRKIVKLAIVGIIMALFVLFLAFFAVYEDNLVGKGKYQNVSDATGNIELPLIEKGIPYLDAVDMANIMLTKESTLKLA